MKITPINRRYFHMCTHVESNHNLSLRRATFYPLNYECEGTLSENASMPMTRNSIAIPGRSVHKK